MLDNNPYMDDVMSDNDFTEEVEMQSKNLMVIFTLLAHIWTGLLMISRTGDRPVFKSSSYPRFF